MGLWGHPLLEATKLILPTVFNCKLNAEEPTCLHVRDHCCDGTPTDY